jgi:hypothetical protein
VCRRIRNAGLAAQMALPQGFFVNVLAQGPAADEAKNHHFDLFVQRKC